MPKGTPELTNARKEEIINACETLYRTMGFKDVTLKEIAHYTSLSRPSIYNYFETKEEIFLAILQREYELWVKELDAIISKRDAMTKDEIARTLAETLDHRQQLLKLMSMNHFDMEANSRDERLIQFKVAFGNSIKAVGRLLEKFCPDWTALDRETFLYAFFPFIYGIYPYTVVTEKQRQAMADANVGYIYLSTYEITYRCAKKLLGI